MTNNMQTVTLQVALTEQYSRQLDRIRKAADLRKCRSWPEILCISGEYAQVELDESGITLRGQTAKGIKEEHCGYDSVLGVTELREGILLRISHKRLLFLPAAESGAESEALMAAVYLLSRCCRYLFKRGSVGLKDVTFLQWLRFRTRKRQGYYEGEAWLRMGTALLIAVALFMGTMFVSMPFRNYKVSKGEAESVVTCLLSVEGHYRRPRRSFRRELRYILLNCSEGEQFQIRNCYRNEGMLEQLESIPVGTSVEMLLHPKSGTVLELVADDRVYVDFEGSQDYLWRESLVSAGLGVLCYAAAPYLIVLLVKKKI